MRIAHVPMCVRVTGLLNPKSKMYWTYCSLSQGFVVPSCVTFRSRLMHESVVATIDVWYLSGIFLLAKLALMGTSVIVDAMKSGSQLVQVTQTGSQHREPKALDVGGLI